MGKIDNIPNWLRWTLFLLFAILAGAVGEILYPIIRVIHEITVPFPMEALADKSAIIIGSAVKGFLPVYAGARMAPEFKVQVGIVLTGIFTLFFAFIVYGKYIGLSEHIWFEVVANLVAGVGGAVVGIQATWEDDHYNKWGAREN